MHIWIVFCLMYQINTDHITWQHCSSSKNTAHELWMAIRYPILTLCHIETQNLPLTKWKKKKLGKVESRMRVLAWWIKRSSSIHTRIKYIKFAYVYVCQNSIFCKLNIIDILYFADFTASHLISFEPYAYSQHFYFDFITNLLYPLLWVNKNHSTR